MWQYLTDSELRARWFAGGPIEQQAGGQIDLLFRNSSLTEHDDAPPPKFAKYGVESRMGGTFLEGDPPRVLAFTFGDDESPSHVRFELTPKGAQALTIRACLTFPPTLPACRRGNARHRRASRAG